MSLLNLWILVPLGLFSGGIALAIYLTNNAFKLLEEVQKK